MNRKVIYINSLEVFRDAGTTNEDFTITKNSQEFSESPKKAKLISACIPYTWNNITSSNNTFDVIEDTVGTDTITIPEGNYTGLQLATVLTTLLNDSGVLTQVYIVTFDEQTLLFSYSTTGANGFQFTFTDDTSKLLGFAVGTSPGAPSVSFLSDIGAILLSDYEIFICSDMVIGSDNGVIPWNVQPIPDAYNQNQILARVPIRGCFSSILNYTVSIDSPFYLITQSKFAKSRDGSDPDTPSIRFFLRFPSGATVDLNGYHWTAEIVLEF